jgi:hypothetical protein
MTTREMADERLDEAARALAERLPAIDARLDDAVMAAVRRRPAHAPVRQPSGVRWLFAPRPVQVRPVWALAMAAALAALWFLPRLASAPAAPAVVAGAATPRDTVFVRFELAAPTAHAVAVAGSFNGWNGAALPLVKTAAGTWAATVALPVGEHRYQFVVDGTRWVSDPTAQSQADDGFGGTNSVIVVGPKGLVRS